VLILTYISFAVIGFLLGSIPFGYLLVRFFTGSDIRTMGSGNIGATNVARSGNKGLALLTLLLDAGKGFVTVQLAIEASHGRFGGQRLNERQILLLAMLAGFCAVAGHMFTPWLKFKGGKGVATGCGVFFALSAMPLMVTLGIFVLVVLCTRYVSLGSVVASAVFPLLFLWWNRPRMTPLIFLLAAGVAFLIIYRHKENLARIFAGTESRFGRPGRNAV